MRGRTLKYLLREGFRGIVRHRALSATAVATMAASLLVLGVFMTATYNIRRALADLEGRKEVVVYLKDGTDEESRGMLERRLHLHPAVAGLTWVSKDEAWARFSETLDGEGLLDVVGGNPLPDAYRVALDPARRGASEIEALAVEVRGWDEVEEVVTGGTWVASLDRFARGVLVVTAGIGLAVALSIIAIVANTVRLTIIARRDLIVIMKDVGASDAFIRIPFLSEGVLQSLIASLLALGGLWGATLFLDQRLQGVVFLSPLWCLGFIGFALLLGLTGSLFSVRHVLRQAGL